MSRGADSAQKTVGFGWSRADERERVRNPGSWLSFSVLISAQSPPLTLKGTLIPHLQASCGGTPAGQTSCSVSQRFTRASQGRGLTGVGCGDSSEHARQPGSREGLFWPARHPYLATNLKPGSPFGFFTFWLLYFFQVVPKLRWEKRGVFNKLPKLLTFANWNFEQVA